MTRIVLPAMLRRQRGIIVNLSSISSLKPLPLMGIYAATKVSGPSLHIYWSSHLNSVIFFLSSAPGIHWFSLPSSQWGVQRHWSSSTVFDSWVPEYRHVASVSFIKSILSAIARNVFPSCYLNPWGRGPHYRLLVAWFSGKSIEGIFCKFTVLISTYYSVLINEIFCYRSLSF